MYIKVVPGKDATYYKVVAGKFKDAEAARAHIEDYARKSLPPGFPLALH